MPSPMRASVSESPDGPRSSRVPRGTRERLRRREEEDREGGGESHANHDACLCGFDASAPLQARHRSQAALHVILFLIPLYSAQESLARRGSLLQYSDVGAVGEP
jgi:hypothetical protein